MDIIVFTIESEAESARRLGYTTTTYNGDFVNKYDNKIVIRWGNSRWLTNRDTGCRESDFKNVINPAKVIRQNCEKANATKLLAQIVNVPTLWETKVPEGVLAVVRPHEHSAGYGFSVQKGPFDVQEGTYATRYLDVTKEGGEYRVWFCGNRTMVGRRVKMECNEAQEFPCRSNWGYSFLDGISKDLRNQTLLAAKKIGLESGAADVLFYKGKWYFLELNSAPSIDHRVVREFYQAALSVLIERKFPGHTLVPVVEVNAEKKKQPEENVVLNVVVPAVPPVVPQGETILLNVSSEPIGVSVSPESVPSINVPQPTTVS